MIEELKRKTVYLAGPMRSIKPDFNFAAFDAAAVDLRQRGYNVINPAAMDRDIGFDPSIGSLDDFDLQAAITRCVESILGCDLIVMLPGHETSKGATAERHVAIWLGLPVLSYPSMVPLNEVETAMDDFVSVPPKEVRRFKLTAIEPSQELKDDCIVPHLSPGEWTETLNTEGGYSERTPVVAEPAELKAQIAYGWSRNWDGAIDGGDDSGCVPIGREKLTEATAAPPKDGDTTTNDRGGKQSHLSARFDCIPPEVLKLLAQCLGFGAKKYGPENWKNIDQEDNLAHAMNHINEYRLGDRSEPHLVNTMARVTFALWQAIEKGDQPTTYIHPDMVASK